MRRVAPITFLALSVAFAGGAASCSSGGGSGDRGDGVPETGPPGHLGPVCEPDTAAHCTGDGGCLGGQLCGEDGTYGECVCVGDTGTFPSDAGRADSGPVRSDAGDAGSEHDAGGDVMAHDGAGPDVVDAGRRREGGHD